MLRIVADAEAVLEATCTVATEVPPPALGDRALIDDDAILQIVVYSADPRLSSATRSSQ